MNINFLVNDIGAGQLGYYLTTQLNELGNTHPEIDGIVFYNNLHKHCIHPNFAIMQMIEIWQQKGPSIATSLSTASKLVHCPGPSPKFFYIWDLEWLRHKQKTYSSLRSIICVPDLILIARSESHKVIIENCFNCCIKYIVDDFDMEQIVEIISSLER